MVKAAIGMRSERCRVCGSACTENLCYDVHTVRCHTSASSDEEILSFFTASLETSIWSCGKMLPQGDSTVDRTT